MGPGTQNPYEPPGASISPTSDPATKALSPWHRILVVFAFDLGLLAALVLWVTWKLDSDLGLLRWERLGPAAILVASIAAVVCHWLPTRRLWLAMLASVPVLGIVIVGLAQSLDTFGVL